VKKYFPYLLLTAASILFLSNQLQKISYAPDDTFIYMQYARNIASGNGFSFNAGEPSYGITSPLWVIMLSLAYLAGADGFWFAKILDLVFSILSVCTMFRLSMIIFKKDVYFALLTSSFLLLNVWFSRWSFTGMETSLSVFLVIAVFYFYYEQKYDLCFFFLGILWLVRPEGFVLFLVILFSLPWRTTELAPLSKRYPVLIRYLIIFFIIVLPFLVYAKISFGTFVPNTALGKATFTLSLSTIKAQIVEISKTLAPASILEILLSLFFLIYLIRRKNNRQPSNPQTLKPLWLWPLALILIYIVTDSDIISRYLLIVIPVFTVFAAKAIELSQSRKYILGTILFIILTIQSQFVFYYYVKPHVNQFTEGINDCMIPVGEWLKENTPPNSRILINDVGAVGYYSERHIIDAAALINHDLVLNREIMQMPVEERGRVSNLLKYAGADYIVERDSIPGDMYAGNPGFVLLFSKTFPGLGISDPTPRYFKVYKVK
jgi:hypothetical protein